MGWLHLRRSWDWHLGPTRGSTPNSWMVYFVENPHKKHGWWTRVPPFSDNLTLWVLSNHLFGARWCQHGDFSAANTWFNHQTWGICQEATIGYHGMSWCAWKAPPNKLWHPCGGQLGNPDSLGSEIARTSRIKGIFLGTSQPNWDHVRIG
jgi:hypothetical protein